MGVCLWRRRCKWLVLVLVVVVVIVLVMVRVISTIYALRGSKGCAAISRRCLRTRPPSRCVRRVSTESIRTRMSTASTDLRPRQAQRHVVCPTRLETRPRTRATASCLPRRDGLPRPSASLGCAKLMLYGLRSACVRSSWPGGMLGHGTGPAGRGARRQGPVSAHGSLSRN